MSDDAQPPTQQDLDHVLALERELQTPVCRADEARLRQLFAPDFMEIGASGRRWDLDSTLALLREETADEDTGVIDVVEPQARALGPGVIQVFWDSRRGERRARRTSI